MKLVADLHTHTSVSDHAFSTLEEMFSAGYEKGLKLMNISNHAPGLPDGAHIMHFESLPELPRKIKNVFALRGAEVNILDESGRIDLPDEILENLDFVVASFHKPTFPEPSIEKCTKALENILPNRNIHLLAHLGTPCFAFDYERIISQCNKFNKAVELNGSSPDSRPGSRENCLKIAKLCVKYDVPIFIDSDAHFSGNLYLSDLAVEIAEEARVPERQIINADWQRLCAYLSQHCGVDPEKEDMK